MLGINRQHDSIITLFCHSSSRPSTTSSIFIARASRASTFAFSSYPSFFSSARLEFFYGGKKALHVDVYKSDWEKIVLLFLMHYAGQWKWWLYCFITNYLFKFGTRAQKAGRSLRINDKCLSNVNNRVQFFSDQNLCIFIQPCPSFWLVLDLFEKKITPWHALS